MVSAAAKQLQDMYYSSQEGQSGTESSAGAHRRPANGLQRSDSPREMGSSDERISASTSGSTTTISEGTKDKLRAMIQSKKNRQKLQSVGNSPYEVLHGTPADDYSLRKASSEPNLKMRTVAALRAKLAPHRTSPKSPHQATPYAKPFAMAQKSSSVAEMGVRRMDLQAEMIESIRPFNAAPSENQMDTGEPSDDVWHRPAIVGSDRRGQFLAAAPPPNFLAAALVAANRAAPGGGGLLHQQLLRPQPLYTSPSLPEINSNAALRHLALQSSLQAAEIYTNEIPPAVWQEIFGPSAAYLSALRSSAGLPFGTAAAPLRSQNQSNPVGPIPTQLSSSLNNEVVTDSHGYDSLMGRNVLFAATTASSHREAMKLLDSHSSSLPSTSHMGVVTSSSDFIAGSGGMASNNALKEQLRDIILRRKSLVKEETEDEVITYHSSLRVGRKIISTSFYS